MSPTAKISELSVRICTDTLTEPSSFRSDLGMKEV